MTEDVERAVPRIPTGWEEEHSRDPLDLADSLVELALESETSLAREMEKLLQSDDRPDWVDLSRRGVKLAEHWRAVAFGYRRERDRLRERVHDLEEMLRRERFG